MLKSNEIDESWVFKTTSDDYKTLELISKRYPMVERYEEYINNGEYIKAQEKIDRKLKEKTNSVKSEEEEKIVSKVSEEVPQYKKGESFLLPIVAVLILILLVYRFMMKK